jgi:hypothetical protein
VRFLTVYSIPMQFDTLVIMVLVFIHIAAYAFNIAVRFAARNEKLILEMMLFAVLIGWVVTWWMMSVDRPMQMDTLVIVVLMWINVVAFAYKVATRAARNEKLVLWKMLFSVSLGWSVTSSMMSVGNISYIRALERENMRVHRALDKAFSDWSLQTFEFQACKNYLNECADSSTDVSAPMWMGKFN